MSAVNVIGGGLAGCEAAYYIANQGISVKLWEMRPIQNTPVHRTPYLAELVCSNSLKSEQTYTAQGLLKAEMRTLGSLLLSCAEDTRVPAGSALAVDRDLFAEKVTRIIENHPHIEVIRQERTTIPADELTVIATGPLTSDRLWMNLHQLTGRENLFFYDAVAPSVTAESLDMSKVYRASRYGKGSDDYLNCPLTKEEYERFYSALVEADVAQGHSIDRSLFFNACMPVEVIARRGIDTLRYGPMRPVGLNNPHTNSRPYAVVQLRQEDKDGRIYGLVGFQTRIKWGDQDRVFRMIPGLEKAEFVRYGVMHRNSYINSPQLLYPTLQLKDHPHLLFAGQITGVEGYMESAATGIIAGINAVRLVRNLEPIIPGENTMIGALLRFISTSTKVNFQPINASFGLLPELVPAVKDRQTRYQRYVERAIQAAKEYSELLQHRL